MTRTVTPTTKVVRTGDWYCIRVKYRTSVWEDSKWLSILTCTLSLKMPERFLDILFSPTQKKGFALWWICIELWRRWASPVLSWNMPNMEQDQNLLQIPMQLQPSRASTNLPPITSPSTPLHAWIWIILHSRKGRRWNYLRIPKHTGLRTGDVVPKLPFHCTRPKHLILSNPLGLPLTVYSWHSYAAQISTMALKNLPSVLF